MTSRIQLCIENGQLVSAGNVCPAHGTDCLVVGWLEDVAPDRPWRERMLSALRRRPKS